MVRYLVTTQEELEQEKNRGFARMTKLFIGIILPAICGASLSK